MHYREVVMGWWDFEYDAIQRNMMPSLFFQRKGEKISFAGLALLLLLVGLAICWCRRNRDIMKMDVNDQYGVYSEQAEDYKAEEKIEAKDINQEYELSTYDNME